MLNYRLIPIVIALSILFGCSTTPSESLMEKLETQVVPRQVPESCLMECEKAPKLGPGRKSDHEVRVWEYQFVDIYGQCRKIHADCVAWHMKNQGKER